MFIISLILDFKKLKEISITESIIYDAAYNSEVSNIYEDYELEGINKHIKSNNKIIISEFENIDNFIIFLKFIKSTKFIDIEYIYKDNNILYVKKNYINKLDKHLYSKEKITKILNNNKTSDCKDVKTIYTVLYS